MPKTKFNWKGITDNGDGTYTAASRIERRRLIKSLHGSGYSVRSTQQADGSWKVAAIGSLSERHRRSPASGYKMKTRYNRQTGGRYIPVAKRRPGRYVGGPQPIIVGGGTSSGVIPRGPSVYENFMRNRKARKVQQEAERKQMIETDAKMKKERIEAETKQQREKTARTIRKEEFAREKARFEHTRLQQERDAKAKAEREQHRALYDNPIKPHVVPRHTPPMHLPPRAQRPVEPYIKPPHVEKVPKVDPLVLQAEREREVSGG
jgi:flagellar biosynthesis GTPase FlhF